jgi:putative FmdB family regulatory protein
VPIYEYECVKCGHKAEVLQRFSDSPVTECTVCHGGMKKLISQSTFHLKGSGWYVTDYASKSGGNQGNASKAESKASDGEKKATGGEKKTTEASPTKKASSDS